MSNEHPPVPADIIFAACKKNLLREQVRPISRFWTNRLDGALRWLSALSERENCDRVWPQALLRLAVLRGAERGEQKNEDILRQAIPNMPFVQHNISEIGLAHAIDGYTVQMFDDRHRSSAHEEILHRFAHRILAGYPRLSDGCLPYSLATELVLVDGLGMVCPFLAAYGVRHRKPEAVDLAKHQLKQFITSNVDPDSNLPFHGYRAGGPYRLGVHGWGRGVGWYLIGLVDTLAELREDDPDRPFLVDAFGASVESLIRFQRNDGHWGWAPLYPDSRSDASVAAFCGYAMARGRRLGVLDSRHDSVIDRAFDALRRSAGPDGIVDGSSGECRGLLSYSRSFGPRPWLQGAAGAFIALWDSGKRT